jgi:PAS domain S-box-containing protein
LPILATLDPRALFDASPNAYVLLDSDITMVAANRAYLRVTMRQSADILGRRLFDAFPSDPDSPSGKQLRQSFARVLQTGEADHIATIHYPIARDDGSLEDRYWSATHTPLHRPDGGVQFILQHTEDVTELVQLRAQAAQSSQPLMMTAAHMGQRANAVTAANLALGAERDVLRQMFELTPGLMAVTRGPDHVFEIVNPALHRLLGDRACVGLPLRTALPELAGQGFFEWLDGVYTTGEAFVGHNLPAQLQRTPGGRLDTVRIDLVFQALRDAGGQVQGVFIQGQDVTGQVLAQQEALAHAERFQTLAHSLPNQVWTADASGLLDWCNAQTRHYSGLEDDDLLGRGWARMVHPDDLPAAAEAWSAAVTHRHPYHVEFRLQRHDGLYRWHIARALPLSDAQGQVRQWVGTNTDIDDQKAAQALLGDLNNELARRVDERSAELERAQEALRQSQKLESIGLLAGGIAHDFNNLLQVLGGNLQLATRALGPANDATPMLDRALGAVQRGARLAAHLLAFSRRQPLQPRVINIGRLVRDMDELLRRSLGEAVQTETVVAGELWNTLVDPAQVESALLNLAINARDAMSGHGRLTIEAANVTLDDAYEQANSDTRAGDYVMLAVTDTGAGMTAEVARRAFEPFFTTKPAGQSSGLGLSMVYGFIKQSSGHVKVYSEPGMGTTVRLYLPRCTLDEDQPEPAEPLLPERGHECVLVAEDDDGVRDITVALLKDLGYQVLVARDGPTAMGIVDSGVHIDLLFTDVVMPGAITSTELARRAQRRLPGIAVLFTSGYTENAIVHGGRLDADVQLLSKPYNRDALARKLRQTLRLAAQAQSQAQTQTRAPTAAQDAETGAPESGGPPLRVLVCEDDALVRESLDELLQGLDCTVATAATVAQARDVLPQWRPDLLITDLGLHDGNGQALAAWALAQQPGLVVAIASGRGSHEAATDLPGAYALPKPFDIDQLTALLDAVRRTRGQSS